jgi:hypothetical protein
MAEMQRNRWIKLDYKQQEHFLELLKTTNLQPQAISTRLGITPYYFDRYIRYFATKGFLTRKDWTDRGGRLAGVQWDEIYGAPEVSSLRPDPDAE